jgi:hypothetical protein
MTTSDHYPIARFADWVRKHVRGTTEAIVFRPDGQGMEIRPLPFAQFMVREADNDKEY